MSHVAPQEETNARSRRAPWRQKLVDAERGFTLGFRQDSTLFVQLFVNCVILAAGWVIDLHAWHWVCMVLALTVVLCTELMNLGLQTLLSAAENIPEDVADRVRHAGTAATVLATCGGLFVVTLTFLQRLKEVIP